MSQKELVDFLSDYGPSERHRNDIQQSWFGTLLGQATVAVGMLLAYLVAINLLDRFVREELEYLYSVSPVFYYCGIGLLPLGLVAVFSLFPTIQQARREHKLRPLSRRDNPPGPGYFRMHPYEASEADKFSRPDGAVEDALAWLDGANTTVLYLSGASGSGKSSLVNAGLAPVLQTRGWDVFRVRGMGAPITALSKSLQGDKRDVGETASTIAHLRSQLIDAGEARKQVGSGPLLVIMDQFEEFLILDQGAEKESYAAFLRDASSRPIPNVRLLHVFRSDYRELIFRENLPDYVDRESAFSLPSFTRRDAYAFLERGPVQLDEKGYEDLFVGLDRIEETHGLYRPITLNMVGFVLERQGTTLDIDPGNLIESYLRDCISHGEARDFASNVLEVLITPEGTKKPLTVSEIVNATHLENWQVMATLCELRRTGLVRSIGDIWEISHDFLARLINQITARLRRPWVSRFATPTLAIGGIGWLIAMGVGVPAWAQWQEANALQSIRDIGFVQGPEVDDGMHLVARQLTEINDSSLVDLSRYAQRLKPIHALTLRNVEGITTLAGIKDLTELRRLDISGTQLMSLIALKEFSLLASIDISDSLITDLAGIEGLTSLRSLDMSDTLFEDKWGSEGLAPLSFLTSLKSLDVSGTSITGFAWAEGLASLTSLDMSDTAIDDFAGIAKLTSLTSLDFSNSIINDFKGIEGATSLKSLDLTGVMIDDFSWIGRLTSLASLNLSNSLIDDFSGIAGLTSLKSLDLTGAMFDDLTGIEKLSSLRSLELSDSDHYRLDGIERLTSLTSLNLSSSSIYSLTRLVGLTSLRSLDLSYSAIDDLTGIEKLTSLTSLNLRRTSIQSLEELQGLTSLESLDLSHTIFSDFAALEGLTSLTSLKLSGNQIENLNSFAGLPSLASLDLSNSYIVSVDGAEKLTSLTSLDLSHAKIYDLAGLDSLNIPNLTLSEISKLQGGDCEMVQFTFFEWSGEELNCGGQR